MKHLRRFLFFAALAAACPLTAPRGFSADDVTFASLLAEMVNRPEVTHPPVHSYRSLEASSHDRASVTPGDPTGWFANSDSNQVIRYETNQGRTEAVMMEHSGPGVITRIWTPYFYFDYSNRVGTNLRIYIDGETTPHRIIQRRHQPLTHCPSVTTHLAANRIRHLD